MESADGAPSDVSSVSVGNAEKDATLAVKVALNIRPLIGLERIQGCKDCITVVPGEPQVQIGSHSFTFDHVYGSTSKPMSLIFEECVAPLVEGLFQGYNATVLAYGQTGSGKTYTMGTGYTVGGSTEGVIPQVMDTIFQRVDSLREKVDFQIRVSFIEIHKEEVHDLLDPAPPATVKAELANAGGFGSGSSKNLMGGKPPIQIRETINGGITLAGVTETDVACQSEMAVCLEQGSLCRATGSTMMNTRSSRSHAIFTITLEQRRKWEMPLDGSSIICEDAGEDYLCAKLHLVDLAGSERAKRTGADGVRFKEGVHINKGLLALGNVISALGDEKKRKEGGHVPYRDSKLTRLLQDSLGGNSRTVMIACVSPADSNAEETLNTLKYANRARNIQNKPTINRDPTAAEIQRLRQQVELMQAELLCARAGSAPEEVQLLKEKIAWLEVSNNDLRKELKETRSQIEDLSGKASVARLDRDKLQLKLEQLRSGKTFDELDGEGDPEGEGLLKRIQDLEEQLQRLQASGGSTSRPALNGISFGDLDSTSRILDFPGIPNGDAAIPLVSVATIAGDPEVSAMEVEHAQLQENLDRELQELNKRLEQKEAEMKSFLRPDAVVLKQHFEKKLVELEEEKNNLQRERDRLHNELATLTSTTDEQSHKMQETNKKIKDLETQIADLKRKEENQSQQLKAKQRADEERKRLQEEIHRIKSQKVQLQQKIKSESEQYRMWKAAREKEVLQLRKEGRRTEYEMHKLQGLHQRQKLVLQRKTEEAAAATRRLKELLAKPPRESGQGASSMSNYSQNNEKSLQAMLDQELEMAVRTHEVRLAYEKQMEMRAEWAKELQSLREEEELLQSSTNPTPSMSPGARSARMRLLETMIKNSSDNMVNMASQLSEAEERDRVYGGRMRWHQLRTMGDAKSLLQLAFEAAASAKCRLGEIEAEHKEFKEKSAELEQLLRQSEARRKELELNWVNENNGVSTLTTVTPAGLDAGMKEGMSEDGREGVASTRAQAPNSKTRSKTLLEQMQSDQAGGSNEGHHYITRKAGRGVASTRSAQYMESYSSEGELDMDTEQSDEEWHEDLEKQAVRRTKALGGFRLSSRQKSMSLDRSRSGSNQGLHSQEQEPFGSIISRSSSGESVLEDNQDKERERLSTFSCSCGRSSGCKTNKCECKAAGGFCGSGCGCKAGKCNNREALEVEEGSSSLATSVQMEMAETLAAVGVDQAQRRFYDSGEAGKLLSSGLEGGDHPTKRAERLLIVHGATLLESAWKEEIQNAEIQEEVDSREAGQDPVEDVASKRQQRRVLKDIGNTKVNGRGRASGKQKKVQLIQLMVQAERPPNTAAAPPVAPAATPAATPSQVPPNVAAALPEIVSPLWRQQSLQRRSSTAQLSPLRLRANKFGDSKSGVGSSNDESGAGKNPKAGNGSGSPARPARQTDEKENIHRNSFV